MPVNGSSVGSEPPRGRAQHGPAPAEMTEAEKRAAEWEARHDVAARGRRVPPDVLQHYFAHERVVEGRARGAGTARPPAGDAGSSGTAPTTATPSERPAEGTAPRRAGWTVRLSRRLRRGER